MEKVNFNTYVDLAVGHAEIERLEDGEYYAKIPGFQGVWATASAIADCLVELKSVLIEWIQMHLNSSHELPTLLQGQLELKLA